VGHSPPDEFSLDETIFSRIRAAVRNLQNTREQIQKEGIEGDIDDTTERLVCGIIETIEQQIGPILYEIGAIQRQNIKIRRSSRVHRVLEEFLYLVDLIRSGAYQIPSELRYLTRVALEELGCPHGKILIVPGSALSTANLSNGLEELFEILTDVRAFIQQNFAFYWIMYVPPSLTRTPLNWPLIGHEIGHILERQKWEIVNGYYSYPIVSSPIRLPYYEPDTKSYYAQEFQADFVALCYFGPIFARRLLRNYYTRELVISPTHPAWTERFGAIADRLEQMGFSTEATTLRQVSEAEPSLIGRDRIEHLNVIFSKTEDMLIQVNCTYNPDHIGEKKATDRLSRFAVYTDNTKILLNVADKVVEKMLAAVSGPNMESTKRDMESDFDYLLKDSIRLNYIKRLVSPVLG
jgi:hypothetical protein